MPPHIHAWIELGYLYSGSCPHRVHGNSYVLKKGQVYILDSDAPHSIGCLGENDILISLLISQALFYGSLFSSLHRRQCGVGISVQRAVGKGLS